MHFLKTSSLISLVVMVMGMMSATAVTGFEEFNCKEYPLRQSDQLSSTQQTVRVCGNGAGEYEKIPKLLRTLLGIEKPAQHLLPPYEKPAFASKFSNGFSPNAAKPSQLNDFFEMKTLPSAHQHYSQPYPYEIMNQLPQPTEDTIPFDFQPFDVLSPKQRQDFKPSTLDSISHDLLAVEKSVDDLQSYLRDVTHKILTHTSEEEIEKNINIILKLDPSLEELLVRVLQLAGRKEEEQQAVTSEENVKELEDLTKVEYSVVTTDANDTDEDIEDGNDDDNDDVDMDNDASFLWRTAFMLG